MPFQVYRIYEKGRVWSGTKRRNGKQKNEKQLGNGETRKLRNVNWSRCIYAWARAKIFGCHYPRV